MKYYFNFIFLIAQSVFIRSKDFDSDSDSENFYQKPLTTTIRTEVPHVVRHVPIRKYSTASYSNAFFEPRTTTIIPRIGFHGFDSNYFKEIEDISRLVQESQRIWKAHQRYLSERCFYEEGYGRRCEHESQRWCCTSSPYCGDINCQCCKSSSDKSNLYMILGVSLIVTLFITGAIMCYSVISVQHVFSAMSSTIRLPHTDNRNLPSIEPQVSENNNSNGGRAIRILIEQHISSSPPKYDDTMRQNSMTITMQQQSLLPPSYDDFMQRNNRKEETTSSS